MMASYHMSLLYLQSATSHAMIINHESKNPQQQYITIYGIVYS